jgi:hypothetical protein
MKTAKNLKAARFELAPVKTGALNQRLPLDLCVQIIKEIMQKNNLGKR